MTADRMGSTGAISSFAVRGGCAWPPELTPQASASQIEGSGTKADETKSKLSEIGGITVSPTVDTSSLASTQSAADRLLATIRQIGPAAQAAGAQAAAAASSAIFNSGKVALALAGAAADRGMG